MCIKKGKDLMSITFSELIFLTKFLMLLRRYFKYDYCITLLRELKSFKVVI